MALGESGAEQGLYFNYFPWEVTGLVEPPVNLFEKLNILSRNMSRKTIHLKIQSFTIRVVIL